MRITNKHILRQVLQLILVTVVVLSFTSCKKKYPEGGTYSLMSKKARLENSWVIAMVIENDSTDKTIEYQNTYKNYNMVINKDGTYGSLYKLNGTDIPDAGNWKFSPDKTIVVFTANQGGANEWKIIRLKKRELWVIDSNFAGKKVEFHFVPKN